MNRFTLLAVMGLIATGLASCGSLRRANAPDDTTTTPKNEAEKAAKVRYLKPFEVLQGTPYRLAKVNQKQDDRAILSSSSGYSETTHNYIFLNADTKDSVKLLPKSNAVFTRLEKIGKLSPKGELSKVEALWYLVIQDDSNQDGQLDYQDKSSVATSTIAGESFTTLIPQVDTVLNTFQSGPTNVLMVYSLDRKHFVAELDLAAQKVLLTKELPSLE
jgi:hypothetical protein